MESEQILIGGLSPNDFADLCRLRQDASERANTERLREILELSRRLDALEAAHNTLAADVEDMKPHDASGYTLPKDQPVKCPHCGVEVSGRTWNMSCPMCGVIMLPATETVGERIATQCAFWEKRRECAAAIDATVKEANARAEKAEAEVKRLSDPGWIENLIGDVYRDHRSYIRSAFLRHVRGGGE